MRRYIRPMRPAAKSRLACASRSGVPPATESREPLRLMFPRPLDWALVSRTIVIVSADERLIEGRIGVDQCERRWSLTPTSPWAAGYYQVRVASGLEDVCGNSVIAAFDRPLREGDDLSNEAGDREIAFQLI